MQTLRWAIVGIGRFGMIHARALQSLPGVELAAVCHHDADRAAAAAAELGVSGKVTDYRRLLEDPDIDVVTITTHWQQHFEIARDALASGKHVFLEKPMAATGAECRQLVDAANAARGRFMVGHICRFDPRASIARQAVIEGRLGRIVTMRARRNLPWAPGPLRLDKIGPLMGDGVHDVDLMMWMLGRAPTKIYGCHLRVDQFKHPDVGWAMLHFGDDVLGVIEANWRLPANVPTAIDAHLEIVGTEGMLKVDCGITGLSIIDPQGQSQPDTVYWPVQHGRQIGALSYELAYFADCVRRDVATEVVTPIDAARAVMVMEAAEQSATLGEPLAFVDPWA